VKDNGQEGMTPTNPMGRNKKMQEWAGRDNYEKITQEY